MHRLSNRTANRLVVLLAITALVTGILISSKLMRRVLAFAPVQAPPATLTDNFNDNSLDTTKWDPNNLFSGFTDTGLPLAETNQRLQIGPLLQNTGSSHYRGIRTVNSYGFNDSYSYVELVQAAAATTGADAMFTVGTSVDNYYRLYVSGSNLYGLRKVGGVKTTLFTISYDTTNHRFLRIRHDANTGNVTLDTATGNNGVPGTWVQRYSEAWNSSISLTGMIFEVKGGTSQAETNAPGTVIFDNFQYGSNNAVANPPTITAIAPNSGSINGGTWVTISGTNFSDGATVSIGGSPAGNVTVVDSTHIAARTPAHAAGTVNVVVTNADAQSATLNNGFTFNASSSSETVLIADDFNDNALDAAKWNANNLFSGFTDTSVPLAETGQHLEIGPLFQNTSGSHYRGLRTVNTYDFTHGYSYVELVQPASATTGGDAMFTVGNDVDNYYRIYVSAGVLYGLRKIAGTKTTLFSMSYDATNHRFLRIAHQSSGAVSFETAPGNAGVPGTWTQRYSEIWQSSIPVTAVLFEIKGGTFQSEANAPNKVIFDNFKAAVGTSASNEAPLANPGGPYTHSQDTAVQLNGSASSDPDGTIQNYQWDFGDSTTGSGPAPQHTYGAAGTYVVTLTVTDNGGLTGSGSTTVTIYPASNQLPVSHIAGAYSAVTGTPANFSATGSYDPDGTITQYKWDFAGLGTSTGPSPAFTFTQIGTHVVTLTVTDNWGAKSQTSVNVAVAAPSGGEHLAGDADVSDWDPINRRSIDDPRNDRGTPANKATGNNNFQIVAPVLSLPGRGMDLNLNLVYNSLLWTAADGMYFDIDHDWPAPGWHLGFGKMVNMGTAGCVLMEPDGSRHSFNGTVANYHYDRLNASVGPIDVPVFKGETTDGSMIEYRCEPASFENPHGVARYPNGTVVYYLNLNTDHTKPRNYLYPQLMVDNNGNVISISYLWEATGEPRIERIVDTTGRVISFHYDTQKRLTSITAPGLNDDNGAPTTRTFVRLHYKTLSLGTVGAFVGTLHVRDSSPQVVDAIYYPGTDTGYWFGATDSFSSYGMLRKVMQQRGMTFTAGSNADEQGTITPGTTSHTQSYDYPTAPMNLSAAPVFNDITESWDGGTATTTTHFAIVENATHTERTVTVTNPDGTKTVQISDILDSLADSDPEKIRNGLTKEEQKLDANGGLIQKTIFSWAAGTNHAARLLRTDTTDERGQVLSTVYDQFGDNNSVGRVRELDYSGAVFRTTINSFLSYVDADLDSGIDPNRAPGKIFHPRLINLAASTKVFQGDDGASPAVLAAYTEFKYDEYAETLKAYTTDRGTSLDLLIGLPVAPADITGVLQTSAFFNPAPRGGIDGGLGTDYLTKRGNVTSVSRYADTSNPASPSAPITETMKYDMVGNLISSAKTCCEELSSSFELATQYAFPISQSRGSSDTNSLARVTTSTAYDLKTGLPQSVTNANGRPTQSKYYFNTWRPKDITSPTGSVVHFDYDDAAMSVTTTARLSAGGAIASKTTKYFNGLGQVKKEEALGAGGVIDIVETLYDDFGRPAKQSLPYRTGQTPQWRETKYDPAGRVSAQWEPTFEGFVLSPPSSPEADGHPKTQYFYNEATRPAGASAAPGQTTRTVDAWDRWRWVRLDAAGRIAEVVEPNPAGGTGFQTNYTYNALNKLARVDQNDRVRRFRYDGLGRLTQQKLAETEATLNVAGQWTTTGDPNDRWSDVFTYDQRSNIVSHVDARGVKTVFNFKDSSNVEDPLNRLQSVSYDTSGVPASLTVLPAKSVTYQYRTKASASTLIDVTQLARVDATDVSSEVYDYDVEGRVQEKRFTFAGRTQPMTTTYAYDAIGRIDHITYPEQYHDNAASPVRKVVTPAYDEASRFTGLKVNNNDYASQIAYNASSQVTSMLIGSAGANQLTETYSYEDRTGLLSRQSVKRGSTTLMDFGYGYRLGNCDTPLAQCSADPIFSYHTGQLTHVTNYGPVGEWADQSFQYDLLGRLKLAHEYKWINHLDDPNYPFEWEQRIYWQQQYSYDRYGNRTTVTASNSTGLPVAQDGNQSLTFDSSNRITSSGFSYDPAGNQLENNTGQHFFYDAANRLAQVKDGAGAILATFTYGDSNQRLITQTGNSTSTAKTYYIWEGNSVIAEYVEQTTAAMPKWAKNYIYLGDRLLATESPNGSGELLEFHHPDRLGTKLVTTNGSMTSYQSNLPFGTALDGESINATNRRFTSYDRNGTTGLDYAINRHYDPRQGRFTQVDPVGMAAANLADPQSLNMYTYVGNDPINRTDPDGQFWGALINFIIGLFKSLKPNVINGSFTYHNSPPIAVSFTPNFQNIGIGYGAVGFALRGDGHWLPDVMNLFVDKFQEAVDAARGILSSDNSCSRFFGGAGLGALNDIASVVHSLGSKAYTNLGNTKTGIQMDIPTLMLPANVPLVASFGQYFSVAPNKVSINMNGPFNQVVSTSTKLPYMGGYSPGSLQSRVLQLLHEIGHLVVIRSEVGFVYSKLTKRAYQMVRLVPLLPLDNASGKESISEDNTKQVLKACREEIDKL